MEEKTCEPLLPSVYAPAMVVAANWYDRLKEMEKEAATIRRDLGRYRQQEFRAGLMMFGRGELRGIDRVRDSSVALRWVRRNRS